MTQSKTSNTENAEIGINRDLRQAANFCGLWRVCANAQCRRARTCRGRARLCGRRNAGLVPSGVREFLIAFLAAKQANIPFEEFRDALEDTDEADAFFAWHNGQ
jgi:hypothetical protein